MAISEDTAALVAAQLTVAWAMRMGVRKPDPLHPHESEVLAIYLRLRDAARETSFKGVSQTPIGGA